MASQIVVANNAVAPSAPIAGQTTLYVKSDGNLYKKDSSGVELLVGGSTGSTGATGGGNGNAQDHIFNQTDKLVTENWTVGQDGMISGVSISIATPAVFGLTNHGFVAGQPLNLSTTGALPSGLSASTQYFVIAAGLTADAFQVSATVGGAAVATTGTQSGVHSVGKTKDALITKELTVLTGKGVTVPTGASLVVVGAGNPSLGDLYVNTSSAQTIGGNKTFSGQVIGTDIMGGVGSVIQVVNSVYSTSSNTTFVTPIATSHTASITPKFASSKILVLINCSVAISAASTGVVLQLWRGGASVFSVAPVGGFLAATGVTQHNSSVGETYLDSPATASLITYTMYYCSFNAGTATYCVNGNPSSITLMEIKQ